MKANIHPDYQVVNVRCACGNNFETKSTYKGDIQVDICSSCHPFFTGTAKVMDTAGRIDRFKKKFGDKVALGGKKQPKVKAPVRPTKAPLAAPSVARGSGQKKGLSIKEKLQQAKERAAKQQ